MKKISFVIPVYNSEKTIKEVVDGIFSTFSSKYDIEVVLVDDFSKDNSSKICEEIAKERSNVKTISLAKNFGQHNAVITGMRFVDGDLILCMDDDLQTLPTEAMKLIDEIEKNDVDVVYGQYEGKRHSFTRNIGSKINNLMAYMLIGKPKEIQITSFFVIRKFLVEEIIRYTGAFVYLPGIIFRATGRILGVKVDHKNRLHGSSNYNFTKLISLWMNGFTNFSVKPLRISSFIGFLIAMLGILFTAAIIIKKFLTPETPIGWTSLIAVVTIFGGMNLMSLGFVGEYIGRSFLILNRQPQAVIRKK